MSRWLANAELRRNLWLELTPQRLWVAPLMLALVAGVALAAADDSAAALRNLGSLGFLVVTVLWGARLAAQSLSEEFADGTWDGQRTSSLSAWAMCSGKLFGGAAFAWYIGAGCLLLFAAGAVGTMALPSLLKALAALLLLAVFAQALALLATLIGWRRLRRVADSRHRGLSLLLGLLLLSSLHRVLPWLGGDAAGDRLLIWFDRPWPAADFMLASLGLFTGWTLLGLHRAMRAELQFSDRPWTWIAFVLFLQVYAAGWLGHAAAEGGGAAPAALLAAVAEPMVGRLCVAALVALLLGYLFVFAEAKERLRYQRLLDALAARQYRRLLDSPPLWLVNAGLAVATVALTVLAGIVRLDGGDALLLATGWLALLAYLLRDCAIVLCCNFGPSRRRADAAAGFYLLALYLLPLALLVAVDLPALAGLVQPMSAFANPFWLLPALAWAAAGTDLLLRQWRRGRS